MRKLVILALPCFVQLNATIDATTTNAPMYIPTGPVVSNNIANIEKTVPAAISDMNIDFAMDLISNSFRPRSHPGRHLRRQESFAPCFSRNSVSFFLSAWWRRSCSLVLSSLLITVASAASNAFFIILSNLLVCAASLFFRLAVAGQVVPMGKPRKDISTFRLRPQNPNSGKLKGNHV